VFYTSLVFGFSLKIDQKGPKLAGDDDEDNSSSNNNNI
jgi:hypothetical protein